jgi:hydrogenase nickel incorporation protein HypA/HybF
MHELSIACNLVEIADSAARDAGAARVDVVHLRLGVFSGVVKEALLFSYDIAARGTLLENSRLEIEDVPLAVYCPVCLEERVLSGVQLFQCPTCGTPTNDIRQGKEIEIVSVEVPDETANSGY